MNRNLISSYNTAMLKLATCIMVLFISLPAMAGIKAVWVEKDIKTDIASTDYGYVKYISIRDLAKFLEITNKADLRKGVGSLYLENGVLSYTLFSQYITVGDKSYNIHKNIILYNGDFFAPVEYLIPVIDKLMPDDLIYSVKDKSIGLFPALYNIVGLTAQQKINGLLIEVFITEELKYDVVKTNDNWVILTMYQGKIDTMMFKNKRPDKAIYDTKAYQFDNSAQLSIRLRPREFTFVSKLKSNPLRIQIMIKGEGFADTVLSYTPNSTAKMRNNLINVIVVDPGHGGEDNGAIGSSGFKEKEFNLALSKTLSNMLENEGFQVILTRDYDNFIALSDRTKIANEAGADMFISIHANASTNKKARGFLSFFLSDAKTDQARAAAALENASIQFETPESQKEYVSDLDFILLDMVQSEFLKESADLAALIEQNIQKATKIKSRGVDQAGFFVLNKAYMPAVLVEAAFISNKKDEKLLKSAKTRENIAKAITQSVVQFKKKYEAMK
ncbi:MAG: N-acetylmuramoyl-L-alanine amidase [candidate division Zixibacteria bacterium]|nr:N-acetylmuramoyl-L-alanine amidase [candidate division Zixibacteria bacterium]